MTEGPSIIAQALFTKRLMQDNELARPRLLAKSSHTANIPV